MAQQTRDPTLLADAFTQRMNQLGISRREFERRSGLSRQTLFKIENEQHVRLEARTLAILDEHLRWVPGTALALSRGDETAVERADALTLADRESAYRWRIVETITKMTLTELETLVAMMEEKHLGQVASNTSHHITLMKSRLESLDGGMEDGTEP